MLPGRAGAANTSSAAGKFGERQQRGAFHRIRGALRIGIECADGFDRVAEKLDANWLRRFRRKNIDDAAANGELAGHFAGGLLFVAGAREEIEKLAMGNILVALDRAGEMAVELALRACATAQPVRARSSGRHRRWQIARARRRDLRKFPRAASGRHKAGLQAPANGRRDGPACL